MFKKFINKLTGKNNVIEEIQEEIEIQEETQEGSKELGEIVKTEKPEENIQIVEEDEGVEELKDYTEETGYEEDEIEKEAEDVGYIEGQAEEHVEEIIDEVEEEKEIIEEELVEAEEVVGKETKSRFNLFTRLKEGLAKTKSGITDKVDNLLKSYKKIDEDLFEELEEILITADIGVQTTMEIVEDLRDSVKKQKISDPLEVKQLLMDKLKETLEDLPGSKINIEPSPAIILVVGVNGVGKTTSIAKMAYRFKSEGKKVLLAAGDTFRAAAIDQLKIWGDRVGVDVISHQEEADPAAVIFDAVQAAKARNIDVLICDTAGRLHNKKNLMNELGKIFKVVDREYANASKEILLVLDATTGQNAVQQAKIFKEVAQITGLILTKLDGTAKGGVVIGISKELNVPVKLIGVGEQMEDLQEFNPKTFIKAMFGEDE